MQDCVVTSATMKFSDNLINMQEQKGFLWPRGPQIFLFLTIFMLTFGEKKIA